MNKKLIALAVAGACVAPAAMAQTANPVTLYGRVHVTFESVEGTAGTFPGATGQGAQVRRNRVQDQASLRRRGPTAPRTRTWRTRVRRE